MVMKMKPKLIEMMTSRKNIKMKITMGIVNIETMMAKMTLRLMILLMEMKTMMMMMKTMMTVMMLVTKTWRTLGLHCAVAKDVNVRDMAQLQFISET